MRGRAIWAFSTMMVGWVVGEVMKLIVQRVPTGPGSSADPRARILVPVGARPQHHGGRHRRAPVAVAAAVRRPAACWRSGSPCGRAGRGPGPRLPRASTSRPTSWPGSCWVVALRSRHGSGSLGRRAGLPPPQSSDPALVALRSDSRHRFRPGRTAVGAARGRGRHQRRLGRQPDRPPGTRSRSCGRTWAARRSSSALCLIVSGLVLWRTRDWRLAVVPTIAILLQLAIYLTVTAIIVRRDGPRSRSWTCCPR